MATLLLLSIAGAALASDVRRMEAVGAVGIDASDQGAPPRDAARRAAVRDAVRRIALELVPEELRPQGDDPEADPDAWIEQALGSDPYEYATRFRILEDRGSRPALLSTESDTEYVVVVEVHVDAGRVQDRLAARGLLPDAGDDPTRTRLQIVVETSSFAALEGLRRALLAERGVRSALPVELERGHAVLEVEADRAAEPLIIALMRRAPPELRLELLAVADDRVQVRVDWVELPANEDDSQLP